MNTNIEEQIKTEAGCKQLLRTQRFANGKFCCTNCGHTNAYEISKRPNLYECSACGKQTSLTSGTFFHGKKLALTQCFRLLFDILKRRKISALEHAKELDLGVSTVWRWRHQVRLLLNKLYVDDETVVVDVDLLNRVLFRRSVETPAIESRVDTAQTEANEISNDQVAPLTEDEERSVLGTSLFLSTNYHGVSKKYSQLYAAEQRFFLRSKAFKLESLLNIIVRAGPVGVKDIAAYSSPELIVLPLLNTA